MNLRFCIPVIMSVALLTGITTTALAQVGQGCVSSKCHADMGTKEFVHGPVGAQICTVCHNKVEGKEHEFTFSATKNELCFGCHEESRDMMLQDYVHTPAAKGDCIGCHDPHQSDFRYTLKGKAADLCYNCHDRSKFEKEHVHGPVAAGDCNACHNPHASPNENQLRSSKDQICLNCHDDQAMKMTMRHVHAPVKESCVSCHDPHAGVEPNMLPNSPPDLCYGCHTNIVEAASSAFKHDPVVSGRCNACHDVHASDNPRLFPIPQTALCYSCHSETGEFVTGQQHKHGPISDGDCSACHNAHGSEYTKMLVQYFPEKFYMPYETDNYAICFKCHSKDVALEEKTKTLTDFRDGDLNLHYLHVNKEVKGRSCKACHQPHASDQMKHVRESVPFGSMDWNLPVSFTKLDDGGSCVVGCHSPKEYHRR